LISIRAFRAIRGFKIRIFIFPETLPIFFLCRGVMNTTFQNPFLIPPQVESPQSRSWGFGFAFGFQGPEQSTMTPVDIQPEDPDAFDRGVLAGQDAAINGLSLPQQCVDLNAEGGIGPHLVLDAPDAGLFIADIIHAVRGAAGGIAGGIAGGVIFFINLSIALETFTDDPDARLAEAASALQAKLQEMGFNQSVELFIGGGVDTSVADCELMLTPIFRNKDAAVTAAKGIGRPHWLVVSWRTDQSGGATVVANSD
jgi:hypothetical protein